MEECGGDKARNDLSAAVPKFCLALEEHRRTPDGRVRTSQELITSFFPHDDKSCTDRIFKYLPNDARGPIIAAWGIRGIKAALRDTDEKVQSVVHDALVAGDVDHNAFEDGLTPETLVRWLPLGDLWSFWRGGKLTKGAIHKALSTAYELYLFDARWFLDTIQAKGGNQRHRRPGGRAREGGFVRVGTPHPRDGRRHTEGTRGRARVGQDRRQDGERHAHRRSRRHGRKGRPRRRSEQGRVEAEARLEAGPRGRRFGANRAPEAAEKAEKTPADDTWSMPPGQLGSSESAADRTGPQPGIGSSSPLAEEGINVVLEDELLISDDEGARSACAAPAAVRARSRSRGDFATAFPSAAPTRR